MQVSIIGYGYWGPNIVRNVINNLNFSLKFVCDKNISKLDILKSQYSNIKISSDVDKVISDEQTDCIIIATNPGNHFELGMKALQNNKHVLMEKPLAINYDQAKLLKQTAEDKGLVLMTDLTFLYNGAVQKIKEIIDKEELGKILYIDSTRINLGIFQNDINVLTDLATHDLSIINYLIKERPIAVSATGKCHYKSGIENISYLNLFYDSELISHIHCSWSSPVKIRQMLIGGDKKMLIYNDIEPSEKIKLYDSGYNFTEEQKGSVLIDYRIGDVFVPKYDTREALSYMIEDFYNAVKNKTKPLANADFSIEIIKILDSAQKSMCQNGKTIEL
ncbi:MAG: Gfo/Idh/MocA family oxidoreductase [Bacteroidales bacterium]|nr:Gfo/Idh/MocA family oxidoreductase [Bacteroidales bacterium]MDY0141503.1 Gfo/Idh/MocA family oxidoreductase [Bacteroidales bacterium]